MDTEDTTSVTKPRRRSALGKIAYDAFHGGAPADEWHTIADAVRDQWTASATAVREDTLRITTPGEPALSQ